MRPVFFILGWCFFGLGAAGVVVPGLPTVPFMLVALWLFSKSSGRFHDWLYSHRVFGPSLQQWRAHRVIPLKAKVLAVITMTASLAYMTLIADIDTRTVVAAGLVMLLAATYILAQPSRAPEQAELPRGSQQTQDATEPPRH